MKIVKMILLHEMWFTEKILEMCNNSYLLLDFKCFFVVSVSHRL